MGQAERKKQASIGNETELLWLLSYNNQQGQDGDQPSNGYRARSLLPEAHSQGVSRTPVVGHRPP